MVPHHHFDLMYQTLVGDGDCDHKGDDILVE
jgi:hypothetical protein